MLLCLPTFASGVAGHLHLRVAAPDVVCVAGPGELKQSIEEALGGGEQQSVEQRIQTLLKDNPVMLFMKGDSPPRWLV